MRRLLVALPLLLWAAPAAHAAPFAVGSGQHAGIAVDDGGTTYVGWQVRVYEPGDAVELCVVPRRATRCASHVTIPFPGSGYNRSRVSVLLPAPDVVDVVEPRTVGTGAYSFLARSTDGGRTFGPARRISGEAFAEAVPGPDGRLAMVDGPTTLRTGVFSPTGSDAGARGVALGPFLEGVFTDVATAGAEVLAAGSDASRTHAFRLSAGADPNGRGSWQQIDPAVGRQPQLAGIPSGFAAMLEPSDSAPSLFVQRLEGAGWSPPVPIAPAVDNVDFRLLGNAGGRLTALVTYPGYRLDYATSTDGGVLWSSLVTVARYRDYPDALEGATARGGAGAAVVDESLGDKRVRVARFSPRSAPVARRRIGRSRVQVRSVCNGDRLSVVVEAARGHRRVSPARVLRRARFGRARGTHRDFAGRFRARYDLRRRHARIPVRVTPRRGSARTLRLRVRRCGATR